MTLDELLGKPVWQMTGEELLFLARHGPQPSNISPSTEPSPEQKRYVYGLAGLARPFGCSLPPANPIKQRVKINRPLPPIGRKIIIDAALALELPGSKPGGP